MPGNFDYLPIELQLAVAHAVANLPNRRDANEGLNNLRRSRKHVNQLILGSSKLQEIIASPQRYPGTESRYVAVGRDVVAGKPVRVALEKNGPFSREDPVDGAGMAAALQAATAENLADLAEAFSARADLASEKALKGVAVACADGKDAWANALALLPNWQAYFSTKGMTRLHLHRPSKRLTCNFSGDVTS